MGWIGVLQIGAIARALPGPGIFLLALGGLLYTAGTVFYLLKFRFAHAVWHLFVLGGSIAHFFCVLLYVTRLPG